ncbi:MAG: hypothetical protein IVW57_16845 [Ktedonobacterales bacterium]|nr:hypothetical protein [Ktedonobacterales bacterium]
MNLEIFLLILAAALALPGGLFIAYLVSEPRARWASLLGGIIGDGLTGLGIYYYVRAGGISIDALSYWFGAFFGCSVGVLIGALVVNFVVGSGSRSRDISSIEM